MNYLYLILGMALVTFIPRLLPLLFLSNKELNPSFQEFLKYIPHTSLSILLIRGIITSSKDILLASIIGILLAGLISYRKPNIVVSVIACILVSFIMIQL